MRFKGRLEKLAACLFGGGLLLFSAVMLSAAAPSDPQYLDQGRNWASYRDKFYTTDQGSQLIRLAWLQALTLPDGTPFLSGSLTRYGYIANPASALGLPVGFTANGAAGSEYAGMTCAACHTREIEADGTVYRIDGGPALADFQAFLVGLDEAVGRTLAKEPTFQLFAAKVLGAGATPLQTAALRKDMADWYAREHGFFQRALPPQPWGIGRLDAISMIFDRLSGIDLAPVQGTIVPDNIYVADAPVRYPFIWNAPLQEKTQWPGLASNGDAVMALARNLGEVYGVFATFHPSVGGVLGIDFLSVNSADFSNLDKLESMVREIKSPKYPWPVDHDAADRGRPLFQQNCAGCHGQASGPVRFLPVSPTWRTPLLDVGTDTHQYTLLKRTAATGALAGALTGLGTQLKPQDTQFNVLKAAVIGSLADRFRVKGLPAGAFKINLSDLWLLRGATPMTPKQEIEQIYSPDADKGPVRYEARVLYGIWAAAPYLHNGSVPSLAELLKPSEQRMASFALGRKYDPRAVGLAADQGAGAPVRQTTDCSKLDSGNSRCGHDYGRALSDAQRADLLEFLKTI